MDPNTLRQIIEEALRNPWNFPWLVFLILILVSGLGSFLGSFFEKKGENLADKQDIKALTKIVEDVRDGYARALQSESFEHQLRMAALERRLAVAQKAYSLWSALVAARDYGATREAAEACEKWYFDHCLYLDPSAREAFVGAYQAAFDRLFAMDAKPLGEAPESQWTIHALAMKTTWEAIAKAGEVIVKSVGLPAIQTESPKQSQSPPQGHP